MTVFVRRTTYVDVNGNSRTGVLTGNASMVAVELALLLESNADVALWSEAEIFSNPTPLPVDAQYKTVADYAELWFTTSSGAIITVSLIAPKGSVFLPDGETVDPASVAGVIVTAVGVLTTLSGDPATGFLGGVRRKS